MKKLLIIIVLGALGYGAWKYLEAVQKTTPGRQDALKPSEKALKEMDKEK